MLNSTFNRDENMIVNKHRGIYPSSLFKTRSHDLNFEDFKNLVSYFSHLKKMGKLTGEEFYAYTTFLFGAFVEKKITEMVNESILESFERVFEGIKNDYGR